MTQSELLQLNKQKQYQQGLSNMLVEKLDTEIISTRYSKIHKLTCEQLRGPIISADKYATTSLYITMYLEFHALGQAQCNSLTPDRVL